jgi:hypothetical protein
MTNKLYGALWVFLVLLSSRMDAMAPQQAPNHQTNANPFYRFDKNLSVNYSFYKLALDSRFAQNRPCYPFTPFLETAADATPLLAAVLVPTGLTNKLVNAMPLDESTKKKVTSSLNEALIRNLVPAARDMTKPMKQTSLGRQIDCVDPSSATDPHSEVFLAHSSYRQFGKPVRSPIIPTLVFVGTYMAIDLTAQSETVATEVNKIPYAKETKQLWNEYVEPGSGTALAQLALFLAASSIRSMV